VKAYAAHLDILHMGMSSSKEGNAVYRRAEQQQCFKRDLFLQKGPALHLQKEFAGQ
jgi:hypothetical protein